MSRSRTRPDGAGPAADRGAAPSLSPQARIEKAVRRVFAPHLARGGHGSQPAEELTRFWLVWRGTLRILRPLGAVSEGNRIQVFADGDDAFEAMWEAIDTARERVWMNTYILEHDAVGRRTLAALEEAARRGCEVVVMLDRLGSHRISSAQVAPLREAGARVLWYNPVLRWGRFSRLVRNHRKILIADEVGFCGGMNVAEEYAGDRHGNGFFRDTHLRVVGPCVRDLAGLVAELVREATRKRLELPPRAEPLPDGELVQVLESNVRRQRRAIQKALRTTTVRAMQRCYLTTPYFVPPARLIRVLRLAAQRGVDVRVLTAGLSDVPLIRMASQHLYGRLLRAGVRIYEMHGRALHAKTTTVDGVYASVGSFNLDTWSDRRNLEVNVSFLDRPMAERIEAQFHADLEQSHQVELEGWGRRSLWQRILSWGAYQLARI